MDNPKLIQVPFAEQSTARNDIPVVRTVDLSAENATYQEGFPSVAMTPVASGGMPPDGKDINGVLNDLSANVSFLNKGGVFKFDASFAADVGGYPKGAVVADANGVKYTSLVENNVSPLSSPDKWGGGDRAVGVRQALAGALIRTQHSKNGETQSVFDYVNITDGVTDCTTQFANIEANFSGKSFDLFGNTFTTTLNVHSLKNRYFNGSLIGLDNYLRQNKVRDSVAIKDTLLVNNRDKSRLLTWAGKNVLWLGTSIPAQGVGIDSYPELTGKILGFTATNMAFSGSCAAYDINASPTDIRTIKTLSMTDADRQAGLALYGAGSCYDDAFDAITKASQMTADYRIKNVFASKKIDVVVLDHNHNDRGHLTGSINGEATLTVAGITKGATTTITVPTGSLSVGDGVVLQVVGIDQLHNFAGRVMTKTATGITLSIDSTAFAGSFVSGTLIKYDRSTTYGSFQFLLHYIKWCSAFYSDGLVNIILAGAPSEYTGGQYDNNIGLMTEQLKVIGGKWGLPVYDVAHDAGINLNDNATYLTDNIHPLTTETRKVFALHWAKWLNGGVLPADTNTYAKVAGSPAQNDMLVYNAGFGSYEPLRKVVTGKTNVLTETFDSGLSAYTTVGTISVAANPITSSNSIKADVSASVTNSYAQRAVAAGAHPTASFDFVLPVVKDPTIVGVKSASLCSLRASTGAEYNIQLVVKSSGTFVRLAYFETPNTTIHYGESVAVSANVVNSLSIEVIRGAASYAGTALVKLNGVVVFAGEAININQSDITTVRVGLEGSNIGTNFTAYIDNLLIGSQAVTVVNGLFTGTFTTGNAKTVTVVNGLIVGVV